MHIVFLGTGSQYPSKDRGVSCIALQFDDGDVWIFDCGEGSQIQLQKSNVKAARISKIFITHLHGDHLFGLPGLLCSIGSWKPEEECTIELYGPAGLRQYLRTSLLLSYSQFKNLKFSVNELHYSDYQIGEWQKLESSFAELRQCKHPSEINETDILPDVNGIYNCCESKQVSVKAGYITHRVPCFGFVVEESASVGRLDVEKLSFLGVPPGPLYGQLKSGRSITTSDGIIINPVDVVGPSILGRKITILGDTCDSSILSNIAVGSDVLIHEATLEDSLAEKAIQNGHSTPKMAAAFAKHINAKTLILTHFSQRYTRSKIPSTTTNQESESVDVLLQEANSFIGDSLNVLLAEDFFEFKISRRLKGPHDEKDLNA